MSISLSAVTTSEQTIAAKYDESSALATMQTVVDELNFVLAFLKTETAYGTEGEEDGGLAGDPFAEQLKSYVRNFTSSPISGFGPDSLYLSYFGVLTNRDGTLSLDTDTFSTYFNAYPDNFSAIAQSRASSSNSAVSATISGDNFTPGTYSLSVTGNTSGTVTDSAGASTSLTYAAGTDNNYLIASSGNAAGLNIISASSSTTASIYMGRSITETLSSYFTDILSVSGDIEDKLDLLSDNKADYAKDLTALDDRMEAQRAVYVGQFSAMEGAVSSFKKTGDYMTNFMESWRAGLG
jgi:flagellar hook-associated protein 2